MVRIFILRISSYSVQMRENTDQNNSEYGHFLRSARFKTKLVWDKPTKITIKNTIFKILELLENFFSPVEIFTLRQPMNVHPSVH